MVSLATVHGHLYCVTDCNIFEVLMEESLLLLQLTPCEQTFHLTSATCVPVFGCMWSSFLESRWLQPSASRHGWNQLCSSLVSLVSTSMRWWAPISRDTVLMMVFGQPETHRNCFSALRGPVAQDLHHLPTPWAEQACTLATNSLLHTLARSKSEALAESIFSSKQTLHWLHLWPVLKKLVLKGQKHGDRARIRGKGKEDLSRSSCGLEKHRIANSSWRNNHVLSAHPPSVTVGAPPPKGFVRRYHRQWVGIWKQETPRFLSAAGMKWMPCHNEPAHHAQRIFLRKYPSTTLMSRYSFGHAATQLLWG